MKENNNQPQPTVGELPEKLTLVPNGDGTGRILTEQVDGIGRIFKADVGNEIVKRYNAHTELVEALKDARATLQRWCEHDPKSWDGRDAQTLENIISAIEKAQE